MATRHVRALAGALLVLGMGSTARAVERFGIGRPAIEAEVAAWNIDIDRDGRKLPPGSGSVAHGRKVFEAQCASCHGNRGEGGTGERLAGGQGSPASAKPIKTAGSFWPYAPTLFDDIRRAMPMNAPQSLSDDDVYAVSGYGLHLNGLAPEDAVSNAQSPAVTRMPNRDGFVPDPRPDVKPGPVHRSRRRLQPRQEKLMQQQ